jgi:hypothetical protein
MRTGIRIANATALAAALAFAAAPASAATAAPKGSCKLLTVREVGEILGTPSGAGKQRTRKGPTETQDQCVWAAKKEGTGGLKGQPLQLELVVESGGAIVNDYQTATTSDPTEVDPVSGLGDDAFVKDLDLHVLVGERVVSVELHNYRYPKPLTQEQILQKEQDAAQLAIGRLPAA